MRQHASVIVLSLEAWCQALHTDGFDRPWDLLFPPDRLYAGNDAFDVGSNLCHGCVKIDNALVAMFTIAMRGDVCCLIDPRVTSQYDDTWANAMVSFWEEYAAQHHAQSLAGPLGAFPLLPDGVAEEESMPIQSIHIPQYPQILVACLRRRGYVHSRSGTIWGRLGSVGTEPGRVEQPVSGIRVGSWMNVIPIVRELKRVLTLAFASRPSHRGSGARLASLVRSYLPVFSPRLVLLGRSPHNETSGAILMYNDVSTIPSFVFRLPRFIQVAWLFIASRTSNNIHVSLIGIRQESRNTMVASHLFYAAMQVFASATNVTSSWICDTNHASRLVAKRAGLSPLQQRFVFNRIRQQSSTNFGE